MRLAITDEPSLKTAAARGAAVLRAGGLVAFPTETVYGLGADATNATAVARVFEAKERPHFDPLIVHLGAADWLERVVESAPAEARRLAEKFWPGPLTLVLPKRAVIPDIATAGLPTVAVRVPAHPVAHAMIEAAGVPVAAPSANRFGRISPTTGPAVEEELGGRIELILDAGPTRHGIESTIVAFDAAGPRVLRPGPVTLEALRECLGREVRFAARESGTPASPGMMESHYAPRTPLRLMDPKLTLVGRVGLLAFSETRAVPGFAAVETLSASGDLREAAANLFAALRRLDAAGLDLIVAEPVPEQGLGVAIMDRLRKAAWPRTAVSR
ncbi:MAG: threonylcarbamoyl-AMP synthase [Verrucomicrobia bacterium]|nr:threonylcarbamoyl-AMP synthase [Verrucomicrobiota bacterium]